VYKSVPIFSGPACITIALLLVPEQEKWPNDAKAKQLNEKRGDRQFICVWWHNIKSLKTSTRRTGSRNVLSIKRTTNAKHKLTTTQQKFCLQQQQRH